MHDRKHDEHLSILFLHHSLFIIVDRQMILLPTSCQELAEIVEQNSALLGISIVACILLSVAFSRTQIIKRNLDRDYDDDNAKKHERGDHYQRYNGGRRKSKRKQSSKRRKRGNTTGSDGSQQRAKTPTNQNRRRKKETTFWWQIFKMEYPFDFFSLRDHDYTVNALLIEEEEERKRKSQSQSQPNISYIALDCEMVGYGRKGINSMLARCSLVTINDDDSGKVKVLYDTYVKPTKHVTDYRTQWSGVTKEHLESDSAVTFEVCRSKVRKLLNPSDTDEDGDKQKVVILVGHALKNDFQVLRYWVS